MTKKGKPKLTLDQPVVYRIQVPGHMDESWLDWCGDNAVEAIHNETGQPITTLIVRLDQAALIGLLRRLYSQGLPLISVEYLEG